MDVRELNVDYLTVVGHKVGLEMFQALSHCEIHFVILVAHASCSINIIVLVNVMIVAEVVMNCPSANEGDN